MVNRHRSEVFDEQTNQVHTSLLQNLSAPQSIITVITIRLHNSNSPSRNVLHVPSVHTEKEEV